MTSEIHSEAIQALRQLGNEVKFVPNLPHSLYAYGRDDLIGQYYKTFPDDIYEKIEDAAEFCHPHWSFDGIAVKVKDKWHFGCHKQFIKSTPS